MTNGNSDTVSVYSIDGSTGALTAVNSVSAGANPFSIAITPNGKFAYVANASTLSTFSLDAITGASRESGH